MALIRFPEGQQRSGSSGGLVFSHNRFGAYIRTRSIPVNPKTPRQEVVRARATTLAQYWRETLTQAQRDGWDEYAEATSVPNKFGDSIHLTGLNHFLRSNQALLEVGSTVQADRPFTSGLAPAPLTLAYTASVATGLISISWTGAGEPFPWFAYDDWFALFYMALPRSAARTFCGGPFRYVGSLEGNTTTPLTSPQTKAASFELTEGARSWVYARVLDERGRLSPPVQATFLIAA